MSTLFEFCDDLWRLQELYCLNPRHRSNRNNQSLLLALWQDWGDESEDVTLRDIPVVCNSRNWPGREFNVLLDQLIQELVTVKLRYALRSWVVLGEPPVYRGREYCEFVSPA